MYKIFDIVNYKTNIRGYWKESSRLYKDNINIIEADNVNDYKRYKYLLFTVKKQLAIFYIKFNKAYIENENGKTNILRQCIRIKTDKLIYSQFKYLIDKYKGLTIYKYNNYYIYEIWQ